MFWYPIWPGAAQRAGGARPAPGETFALRPPHLRDLWGPEAPTEVDRWLLRGAFEALAGDAACARCGAPLGARLRLVESPTLTTPVRWRVTAVTRCWGWRRHVHAARATRPEADILFESFHAGRR